MGLNTYKQQVLVNEQMSGSFATPWIDCLHLTSGSFSFVWSAGSTPSGSVVVYVSNEPNHTDAILLTLSDTLTVSGASGVHVANLDVIPCRYVRLNYVFSSGDAVANVWFVAKGDAN